jgi:hypothetical protein
MGKRYVANTWKTIELALADQINRRIDESVSWVGAQPESHVDKRLKAQIDKGIVKSDNNGLFILE